MWTIFFLIVLVCENCGHWCSLCLDKVGNARSVVELFTCWIGSFNRRQNKLILTAVPLSPSCKERYCGICPGKKIVRIWRHRNFSRFIEDDVFGSLINWVTTLMASLLFLLWNFWICLLLYFIFWGHYLIGFVPCFLSLLFFLVAQ